eukprot:196364-Hanusia_phi.AAC.1
MGSYTPDTLGRYVHFDWMKTVHAGCSTAACQSSDSEFTGGPRGPPPSPQGLQWGAAPSGIQ